MPAGRPRLVIMAEIRLLNPLPALLKELIVPVRGIGRVGALALPILLTLAVLVTPVGFIILVDLAAVLVELTFLKAGVVLAALADDCLEALADLVAGIDLGDLAA